MVPDTAKILYWAILSLLCPYFMMMHKEHCTWWLCRASLINTEIDHTCASYLKGGIYILVRWSVRFKVCVSKHLFACTQSIRNFSGRMNDSPPWSPFLDFLTSSHIFFYSSLSLSLLWPYSAPCNQQKLHNSSNLNFKHTLFQRTSFCSTFFAQVPPLSQICDLMETLNPLTPFVSNFLSAPV